MKYCCSLFLFLLLFSGSSSLSAQWIDDLQASYAYGRITEITLGTPGDQQSADAGFERHVARIRLGMGAFTLGFIYQQVSTDLPLPTDRQNGYMATAGYDFVLTRNLRLEAYGRYGLSSDTLDNTGIYAADSDLSLNLIFFSSSGFGFLAGGAFFPSAYLGGLINKYGRFQAIAGGGLWWQGFGFYLTAQQALNGVENPLIPGDDADKTWAAVKNASVSGSLSYEFQNFKLQAKRTVSIYNGGNDLVVEGQYQIYLR